MGVASCGVSVVGGGARLASMGVVARPAGKIVCAASGNAINAHSPPSNIPEKPEKRAAPMRPEKFGRLHKGVITRIVICFH